MKRRLLRVALLLFGFGMTALIYQVAWMRGLRLVFGASTAASTAASAAVLAIFMGGLGVGGWILGRRADAAAQPRLLREAGSRGGALGGLDAALDLSGAPLLHRGRGDLAPGSGGRDDRAPPVFRGWCSRFRRC